MKILKEINNIVHISFENSQREHGGILGGFNDVITAFESDNGIYNKNSGCYIPNVELLNYHIKKWRSENIYFYGIIHNHLTEYAYLSNDDIKYIEKIMTSMPSSISNLYFPVISSKHIINSFKAIRTDKGVYIVSDNTIII